MEPVKLIDACRNSDFSRYEIFIYLKGSYSFEGPINLADPRFPPNQFRIIDNIIYEIQILNLHAKSKIN